MDMKPTSSRKISDLSSYRLQKSVNTAEETVELKTRNPWYKERFILKIKL